MKKTICATAFLAMATTSAISADLSGDNYTGSLKDSGMGYWVVDIGGYAVAEPSFQGSKHTDLAFQPYVQVYRAGQTPDLQLPNDSYGLTLFRNSGFRIGVAGNYEEGRYTRDDRDALTGLHKINFTAELGVFAEYWLTNNIRTRVEVLQGVTGDDGLLVNFMADYVLRPAPQWQFTVGPRLQVADTQYTNTNFGITAADSAASSLTSYHASGGIHSVGLEATAKYDIAPRWQLRGFLEYKKLLGDASDSPLVTQRGSDDQVRVGVGASYSLNLGNDFAAPLK